MYLRSLVSALSLVSLACGSALPLVKRASASQAGSATVQWLDSSQGVHIRTFVIADNNHIIVNKYDGGPWTSSDTGLTAANERDDAISAVSLRPNTPTHAIHLYYTVGGPRNMVSTVYTVSNGFTENDPNFNALGIKGITPRAAITWPNANQPYPSIRVYGTDMNYAVTTRDAAYNRAIYEWQFENSKWQMANDRGGASANNYIYRYQPFAVKNDLAVVTWQGTAGREIRAYFVGNGDQASAMYELKYYAASGGWGISKSWKYGEFETAYAYSLTAVTWPGAGGQQVRVYRHQAGAGFANNVHEFVLDNGSWTDKALPNSVITDTDGRPQMSSVVWQKPDPSKVHIRLYQYKNGKTAESSFDTGSDWTANTATF